MITQIWSGFTDTTTINKTTVFVNADFLIFESIDLTINEGYEFGGLVVIEIPGFKQKEIPVIADIVDTKITIPIPDEITKTGYDCYFVFTTDISVNIDIFAVSLGITDEDILNEVKSIKAQLTRIELEQTAIGFNQVAQNASLVAIAGTVGAGLALPTAGASLALPGAVSSVLAPTSASLSSLLLPGV